MLRPGRYVNTAGGYYFPFALRVIYCVCGKARSTTDIGLYGEPDCCCCIVALDKAGGRLSLYLQLSGDAGRSTAVYSVLD